MAIYPSNRHKRHNRHRAKVLTGCRETFSNGAGVRWTPLPKAEAPTEPAGETCPAGKTTAVVEGRALTARENVRPVGADFPQRYAPSESPRSRGPRKSRQTFRGGSDIFARCSRESVIVGYAL